MTIVPAHSGDTADGAWAIASGNKKTAPPTVRRETDQASSKRPNSIEDTQPEPCVQKNQIKTFKHRMFGVIEFKNVHN